MKKCQICGKRASMFLTQIINGQATELALCEECAKAKGLFDPQSLTFAEKFFPEEFRKRVDKLINELSHASESGCAADACLPEDSLTRCPVCGFSLENFRNTGRLGCPDCYDVFTQVPEGARPAVDGTSDASGTQGTAPQNAVELRRSLERQLAQAVEREDYEEAARLRDRIRELD